MGKFSSFLSKHILHKNTRPCAYSKMSPLRRGLTLVELTIAMSIGAVLILGISGLILTTNNNINIVKSDSDKLYNAKSLSLSLETNINECQENITYFANSMVIDQDFSKDITDQDILNSPIIFKAEYEEKLRNYIFVNQVFGYYTKEEGNSLIFSRAYACTHRVKLEISKDTTTEKAVFTINYDDESLLNIKLVKFLRTL